MRRSRWQMTLLRTVVWVGILVIGGAAVLAQHPSISSADWRNDEANLILVERLNNLYQQIPPGSLDQGVSSPPPFHLMWSVGPDLPVAWKGGVAGIVGDDIILTGGMWMPGRQNLTYAYNLKSSTYRLLPAPPQQPAYTQGACDGSQVYVVGGRYTSHLTPAGTGLAGRNVFRLGRRGKAEWEWDTLPALPKKELPGRWLAASGVLPRRWLFLVGGHPTGTPSSDKTRPRLPDWRLALDDVEAGWKPMAAFPGGRRHLIISAVVADRLYTFGGSDAREKSVVDFSDVYSYDPAADRWEQRRSTPIPVMAGASVVLDERYVLLLGSTHTRTYRVGKSLIAGEEDKWRGYGDRILCYDVLQDEYADLGVMLYGVATSPWVADGSRLYSFGGEPSHGYHKNTETVLQIAAISRPR